MSGPWRKRKIRLNGLLCEDGDEDAKSLALDRILHGQSVIGKTGVYIFDYFSIFAHDKPSQDH